MKARSRLSKKLILAGGVVSSLIAAYLHFGLCPGDLKNIVIKELEDATHKRIMFSKMLYLPFRGLAFDDLIVGDSGGRLLFSADQIAVDVKIIPFFRDKKIIIRNVFLDHPLYDLALEPETPPEPKPKPIMTRMSGQVTVPVASDTHPMRLEDLSQGPEGFLPENVYIEQVQILDGHVRIRKNVRSAPIEDINSLRVKMGFHRPPVISFDGSADLGTDHYLSLGLKGGWNLESASYEFALDISSQRVPAWLAEYQKTKFLSLEKGRSRLKVRLKSIRETQALFETQAEFQQAVLRLQKTTYEGLFSLNAKGIFNFDSHSFERYKGSLRLTGVNVNNLSTQIKRIDNIKASINFQPDLLSVEEAEGEYQKLPFRLAGQIAPFHEPHVNARIEVDSTIESLLNLFPSDQKKALKSFDIGGSCHAVTTISGPLKPDVPLKMDYRLVLSGGSLRSIDKKINLADLSAELLMDAAGLRLENSNFLFNKQLYSLEGTLPKDPKQPGRLKLSSKDLKLSADYQLQNKSASIQKAEAEYAGIRTTFKGKIVDFSDPYLDIDGDANASLEKLSASLVSQAPWLKDAGLRGTLKGYYQLKGFWARPLEWDFKMDAGSDTLFIKKDLRLESFSGQVRMKNKILNVPYLHADTYHGKTTGSVVIDYKAARPTFDAKLGSSGLDLKSLSRDLHSENKDVAGTAIFRVALRGILGAPETVRGSGSVDIQNGILWKTDEFKQMGQLPFVRVEGLDSVTFTQMSSIFSVRDKKIWTDNLHLISDTVHLSLHGTIDFNQTLDMLMDIHYSGDVRRGADDAGGLAPFMVSKAESMISQYKLSGPLKSPKSEKIGKLPIV